ncbi:LysR family transcriptional regulator [Legionella quinlivanii]|uniref:LysR family transcriptional regulator n=1 Tax=Legionella quinlivanii TaxID=45073 RepID=A0A0W0XPN2_9GAMM|nr:LysR family transcriptional regulator [Legionella quinlivanii]KTD46537.1 LysR family transcriptional regulator [Legionella quinlivanii]SEG09925.1 DNA-binding transcriptional regulator, LysR family [Legionella quinlivanii DSM 21216]STY10225.1 LysR family transcriptional regulator [Legionella quinlivanii]
MKLLDPQLQVFVAVAQHKSMHAAAKAVHLSQTAVTQRIRALETRLRTTLFIRSHHGVLLTSEGEALLRYCQASSELEGITLSSIHGAGMESTVRLCISGPTSIMSSRIIPACRPLLKKYPNLLVTFHINDSEQRIASLQTGGSHFVIIEPQHLFKEMQVKAIKPERYVLVATAAWAGRDLKDILQTERIIDFDESDPMTLNYLKHYNLLEYTQSERHFVNINESLLCLFTEGYGYGVLSAELCQPFLEKKQLIALNSGQYYENKLVLAWYARTEAPSYFADVIDSIV